MSAFTVETIKIPSIQDSANLDVWLYTPNCPGPHPVVVAGHGLTVIKEAGYAAFGESWAQRAGWASLIFDYRGFGDSDGEPRNVACLKNQLEDYRTIIEWARARPNAFLHHKIVVMGSAMSGLQVAELVVKDGALAGGMAHCPMLDAYATFTSVSPNLRLLFWALADIIKQKLGLTPLYIPAVGKPGDFAFINSPSSHSGFVEMFSQGRVPFATTPNVVAPRLVFEALSSRPGLELKNAHCPVLVVMAEEDDLIPAAITRDIVSKAGGKVRLVTAPCGHFEIMGGGKGFNINIKAQLDFLTELYN